MTAEGEPMPGGNTAPVVRVGDTVRRVAGPWTPAVARLMNGLRAGGVSGVPEHQGMDESGREVVEFVAGAVPNYPMPAWVWTDEVLGDLGGMLRRVHDGAARLDLPADGWRRSAVQPVETVLHGDVAPYNCVFRSGRLIGMIDWDYALPGPRLRDLGEAAYRFVTLTPPGHRDGQPFQGVPEQWRRVGLLAQAYGDGVGSRDVVGWAAEHLADLIAWTRTQAAAGDAALQRTIDLGHVELYEGDLAWVRSLLH